MRFMTRWLAATSLLLLCPWVLVLGAGCGEKGEATQRNATTYCCQVADICNSAAGHCVCSSGQQLAARGDERSCEQWLADGSEICSAYGRSDALLVCGAGAPSSTGQTNYCCQVADICNQSAGHCMCSSGEQIAARRDEELCKQWLQSGDEVCDAYGRGKALLGCASSAPMTPNGGTRYCCQVGAICNRNAGHCICSSGEGIAALGREDLCQQWLDFGDEICDAYGRGEAILACQ